MALPTSDAAALRTPSADVTVVADSCLLLSHRLSEWMTNAPTMEEDIALGNIALDLLGQARGLLQTLGDEDQLAYFREPQQWRNVLLCELPRGDFAMTMMRQLFVDLWLADVWAELSGHSDPGVNGVAAKAVKENAYHRRHSAAWVVRLGDGTDESHQRMQTALDALWPYRGEIASDRWYDALTPVLEEATLRAPERDAFVQRQSAGGWHTEHLGYLLAEMQSLARAHPGAQW